MVAIESPIVNEEVTEAAVEVKASAKKPSAKKASAKKAVEAPKASAKKPTKKAPVVSAPSPAPSKKDAKKATAAPTASAPSPTKKASAKPSKEAKEKASEVSSATVGDVKLSKAKVKILMALSSNGQMTRTQLAEATEITSGYCSLVGHADPSKVEEGSLIGLGLVKPIHLEGSPLAYDLTAKGKKAVEKLPKA